METIKLKQETTELHYEHSPGRYLQLTCYSLVFCASLGGLGPPGVLVTAIEQYYGIGDTTYNAVFFISYLDFIISAPVWQWMVIHWGLRTTLITCSTVACIGYGIQGLYQIHLGFVPLIVGGALVDTSRSMILITGNMFIGRWFSAKTGSKNMANNIMFGIAVVVGGVILGISLLLIGSDPQVFHDHYWNLLVGLSTLSLFALLMVSFAFKERPEKPPGPQSEPPSMNGCWCSPRWPRNMNWMHIIAHFVIYVFIIAGTWTIGSLLLEIMQDRGYSSSDRTLGAFIYYASAIPTPVLTALILDRWKCYRELIVGMLCVTSLVYLLWILMIPYRTGFLVMTSFLGLVTGAFSLTYTMTISEMIFPVSEDRGNILCYWWAQWTSGLATLGVSFGTTFTPFMWLFLGLYVGGAIAHGVLLIWPVEYPRIDQDTSSTEMGDVSDVKKEKDTVEEDDGDDEIHNAKTHMMKQMMASAAAYMRDTDGVGDNGNGDTDSSQPPSHQHHHHQHQSPPPPKLNPVSTISETPLREH